MIKLPQAPKQPGKRASLGEWKAHLEHLKEWVHVFEQVQSYSSHKHAVRKMNLKEIGEDGEFRAPKFKRQRRSKHPFPKNAIQRKQKR